MSEITPEKMAQILEEACAATREAKEKLNHMLCAAGPEGAFNIVVKMIEIVALAKAIDTAYAYADIIGVRNAKVALSVALEELGL